MHLLIRNPTPYSNYLYYNRNMQNRVSCIRYVNVNIIILYYCFTRRHELMLVLTRLNRFGRLSRVTFHWNYLSSFKRVFGVICQYYIYRLCVLVYVCLVKDPNLGLFIIRETADTCGRCCWVLRRLRPSTRADKIFLPYESIIVQFYDIIISTMYLMYFEISIDSQFLY